MGIKKARIILGLLPMVAALALISSSSAKQGSDPYLFQFEGVTETVDTNGHNVNGSLYFDIQGASTGSSTGESRVHGNGKGTATTGVIVTSSTTGGSTTSSTTSTTSTTATSGTSGTTGSTETFGIVIADENSDVLTGTDSLGHSPVSVPASTMATMYQYPWGSGTDPTGWLYVLGTGTPPTSLTDTIPAKYLFGSGASATFTFDECYFDIKVVGNMRTVYTLKWEEITVSKQTTNAVSVDSRVAYGSPNLQGEYAGNSADPNAPGRNLNFSGWFYNGGLFTGHVPFVSGDQSGISRTQAYIAPLPSGSLPAMSACFVIYYLANSSSFTDSYTLGSYDASADANGAVPYTSATWANAWNPLSDTALTTFSMPAGSPQYIDFNIVNTNDTQGFAPDVLLAMDPEPSPNSSPNTWSYYVSQWYASHNSSAADEFPRAWVAYQTNYDNESP